MLAVKKIMDKQKLSRIGRTWKNSRGATDRTPILPPLIYNANKGDKELIRCIRGCAPFLPMFR